MDTLDENLKSSIQTQLALQKEIIGLSMKKNKNNSKIFKQTEVVLNKLIDSLYKTCQNECSILMYRNNLVRLFYDYIII